MSNQTEYIWSQKYRPTTLENFISDSTLKNKLESYIKEQQIPNLLFVGLQGSGKTSAAKILANSLDCDTMLINASDENNIETVRTKVKNFSTARSFRSLKVVILDEYDGFSLAAQSALRNMMELFSHSTRYILTANYKERIIEPIISRCTVFEMHPPSKKDVAVHVAGILTKENVGYTNEDVANIVHAHYPDIRRIINVVQQYSTGNILSLPKKELEKSDFKTAILTELKDPTKHSLNNIRQIIADNKVRDFTSLYRFLYDRVLEFAPNHVSEAILAIAEGQYRDALVVDKEITMMATILNILDIK